MTLLDDARATIGSWEAPSTDQERLREEYAALLEDPDSLFKPRHPDHLTASGLVFDRDRSHVLLTLHAKAGRWFQFGGHLEETDETLAGAALREAAEESGITGLVIDLTPVQLDVHEVGFCHPQGGVRHFDVRYAIFAPEGADPVVSAESHDVRWWPADRLPTEEPNLVELVRLARHG